MDVSQGNGIVKVNQYAPPSYPYTDTFEGGARVIVEAVPALGYRFNGWSGDLSGTAKAAVLVMDCNKSITASFAIDWPLIGQIMGSVVLVGFFVAVLIIRR